MRYKHIYGPIPSRRLGISLGIDPIPFKTCPLNCIYCECGATTVFTMERKEYIPMKNILDEINHFIQHNPMPDFITFSGSGEPTMHSKLGEMILDIKHNHPQAQVAVITNSVMLGLPNMKEELCFADIVAPSLDGISETVFRKIDAPMKEVDIAQIPFHLKEFSKQYLQIHGKQLWLEIFIVEGINDTDDEIERFIEVLTEIPYTKIQLNRLDRIGTVPTLKPASMDRLYYMKDLFERAGLKNIEIVGKFKKREEIKGYRHSLENLIKETLERRSHSLEDLALMANVSEDEVGRYLDILSMEKKVSTQIIDDKIVYKIERNHI